MSSISGTGRDAAIAASAIASQIEELKDAGFDVQVLQDMQVVAVVRVSGGGREPTEMLIDPLRIVSRLRKWSMN